jgi:hypothetical protein
MDSDPIAAQAVSRLRRLSRRVARVGELAAAVRERVPRGADGLDASGSVRVFIDAGGVPTEVRVEPGWQRHVAASDLADAVVEAFTSAVVAGMRAWSEELERMPLLERVSTLSDDASDKDAVSDAGLAAFPPSEVAERDLGGVTEEVLSSLRAVRGQAGAEPGLATGRDGSGNVTVSLFRAGLQGCAINPGWAAQQSGDGLSRALTAAVRAAQAELERLRSRDGSADRLAGEALAVLHRLQAGTDLPRSDGR